MNQQTEEERSPSQILATFLAPGSSEFNLKMQGVSPNQLMVLGKWLEWKAHKLLDQVEERRAMNQIAVPGGMVPPDIRGGIL